MPEKKERSAAPPEEEPATPRRRDPRDGDRSGSGTVESESVPPPRSTASVRDPADRAIDDWTPAEAIAEIDQLQSDLDRLRRPRRPPDP
ncbi:MAG TPA: hypothetical protein VIZ68_01225 [Thermoplasmata archaeon]